VFTGLIETLGRLTRVAPLGRAARFAIQAPGLADRLQVGESVSVDGACLTVEKVEGGAFVAYASDETLAKTTLGEAHSGREVNLERSLALGDRLGGHLVAGHVDAMGRMTALEPREEGWLLRISAPPEILAVSVPKGSIAVDGISLTLVGVDADCFTVAVIPHTYESTTLRSRHPGDRVNLESDLIGKYVAKALAAYVKPGEGAGARGRLTMETLREAGYLE
jgi:riboflavin synthase